MNTRSASCGLLGLVGAVFGLPSTAAAERPTEGGLYSFDPTDDVRTWDDPTGAIRVHYSASGPNRVRSGDADADGIPDFAQEIGEVAASVLELHQSAGFRRPLTEDDLGLGPLGGSAAFDIYLVDFAGVGDGAFRVDGCTQVPYTCAGHAIIENDFTGYGYGSVSEAIRILCSHELFHAVQAAYEADLPQWVSEGTAVWAELYEDPESWDFRAFANAYLADTGRSLDQPPAGPVPSFAYGTGLWWDFLTTRHGTNALIETLEALERTTSEPVDPVAAMLDILSARGDSSRDAFTQFASWNLATGSRSGHTESYAYAEDLSGITAEREDFPLDDEERFYPLSATYYRLDHPGGPLWFFHEGSATDLRFSLHPVVNGDADGGVEPALATWDGAQDALLMALVNGADLPAGGYWLLVANPEAADQSTKIRVCVGDEAAARTCAPQDTSEPVDTGEPPQKGCATRHGAPALPALLAGLSVLALRRRRTEDPCAPSLA